ncbi:MULTISPECIES: YkgJ family cysteine cluster protein [unclassified Psychrobacter]|uniref:YkgJ family cysteine cluster protein n=1 Tax=unclassified Psychrobacter TaxID=196806 RepID=UPI0025FC3955|nr:MULTISPECIES: YkgJ family cysteine cluster protein [unclassified Psychrobacter]
MSKISFPCTSCGQCCKNVHFSELTDYLDRGDGTCRHFDDGSNLCLIYEDRPLICRIEDYYDEHLSHLYEWDGFVKMNLEVCEQLKCENKLS